MKQLALLLFAVPLFIVIALLVADAGHSSVPTHTYTQTNESFTQDVGNYTNLSASSIDNATAFDDETVYNSSGHELVEGRDYDFDTEEISIRILSTQNTSDGSPAKITYSYTAKPESARTSTTVLSTVFGAVAPMLTFVVGIFVVLGGIMVLGRV
ncbi:MAG: hypothetical protein SV253_09085 [Halobacteria archaeon]|nr:hypothetical protein [Halobacteria archaeon]